MGNASFPNSTAAGAIPLAYLQDLSAAVKQAVSEGKSYADAQKEIKLPKYEAWPNYNAFLPMNIERYYDFWNRGI